MSKIKYFLLACVYFPIAIIISLIYGIIGGFIFKIGATGENFIDVADKEIRQWKKYPKRAYDQYIRSKVLSEKPKWYEMNVMREYIKKNTPNQPFPFVEIFASLIVLVFLMPFRCISGMIEGPVIVFGRCKEFWNIRILKKLS